MLPSWSGGHQHFFAIDVRYRAAPDRVSLPTVQDLDGVLVKAEDAIKGHRVPVERKDRLPIGARIDARIRAGVIVPA